VNEGKGGINAKVVVAGVAAAAVITGGVVCAMYLNNNTAQTTEVENTNGARGVIVSTQNADELAEEMASAEAVQPGYYTVAMTSGWHFENSTAVSYDAYVANKPENSNNVYFDLFLNDDRENPIYESPVISLGAELDQISLNRELPKGEYSCVMVYHLVDENQETLDTLTVTQTVIIEN
jgi:hypothetical protein